jgi:hypothetical protein
MTDRNAKIKASIFVIVVVAIIGGMMILLLSTIINAMTQFYNRPEQFEQVEVVGKRTKYNSNGNRPGYYIFIFAFEFSDGSVKELEVGDRGIRSNESISNLAYDSIHEGDTGTLIYKEIRNNENVYKNEDMHYAGRFFISFERDSQYGELKIESTKQQFETWHFILLGALVIMWLLFAVFLVKVTRYALKYICRDETYFFPISSFILIVY